MTDFEIRCFKLERGRFCWKGEQNNSYVAIATHFIIDNVRFILDKIAGQTGTM